MVPGANRRYWRDILVAVVLYAGAIFASLTAVGRVSEPWLRLVLALLPLPPAVWIGVIEFRRVLRTDELKQRIELEAATVTLVATLGVFFVLGLLENAGLIRVDAIFIAPGMCGIYLAAQLWAHRRYR